MPSKFFVFLLTLNLRSIVLSHRKYYALRYKWLGALKPKVQKERRKSQSLYSHQQSHIYTYKQTHARTYVKKITLDQSRAEQRVQCAEETEALSVQ